MSQLLPNAYLNGHYLPLAEASISPLDRGFLFGEGVYEVILVHAGQALKLAAHLARLANSCRAIDLDNPLSEDAATEIIATLIEANGGGEMSVYLQITRGTDAKERNHAYPSASTPTVFVMCQSCDPRPAQLAREGVAAVTRPDNRWQRCDIKSTSLIANTILRESARRDGAVEAILLRDGQVTEGAASSVIIVRDGRVLTPRRSQRILPGTTQSLIFELLKEAGVDVQEADIDIAQLRSADEIWVTSTVRETLPVTRLDGAPVGNGKPGPLWHDLDRRYQDYKERALDNETPDTLLAFPCDFPIKIMGQRSDELRPAIDAVVKEQNIATVNVSERTSNGGKYLAVTLTVNATSKQQLDALYRKISALEQVVVVL